MSTQVELVYRQLGLRIEQIRSVLGITQGDLAKRIGLSRVSVTNMEIGRQRIYLHHVDAIAKGLGTTSKNLLKGIWL